MSAHVPSVLGVGSLSVQRCVTRNSNPEIMRDDIATASRRAPSSRTAVREPPEDHRTRIPSRRSSAVRAIFIFIDRQPGDTPIQVDRQESEGDDGREANSNASMGPASCCHLREVASRLGTNVGRSFSSIGLGLMSICERVRSQPFGCDDRKVARGLGARLSEFWISDTVARCSSTGTTAPR